MNISSSQVEAIVRRILGETAGASKASAGVPKTAKVAMLTAQKKIEVLETADGDLMRVPESKLEEFRILNNEIKAKIQQKDKTSQENSLKEDK